MRQYELLYILPPTLTENEAPTMAVQVSGILQKNGVQITQEVDLGKKRLAYPIAKHQYGYYRLVEFTVEPVALTKLNDLLRLHADVVRHQIIMKPTKSPATIEREQALRARLAAKRQQRLAATATTESRAAAATEPTSTLTPEELDKKLEQILEDNPDV